MSFKVFLSYSAEPEEQAIVWRLQTLAAAQGIELIVPPRAGFKPASSRPAPLPASAIQRHIDSSDCVLAIVTTRLNSAVEKELSYALGGKRLIIPIVAEGLNHSDIFERFPVIFTFSPWKDPGETVTKVMQFLDHQKLAKENRQALGALIVTGLGLLLLSEVAKK
jgi:hypothetical protein